MKNLKINLKRLIMKNMLAIVLLTTPATLTGCSKQEEVEVETEPTYIWADDTGIVLYDVDSTSQEDDEIRTIYYADKEDKLRSITIDEQNFESYICSNPSGKTIYKTVDAKKVEKFIKKNDLISIEDNIDTLLEETADNGLSLGHEYITYLNGKKEQTGQIFLIIHYYQTYQIIVNDKGKCELVEGNVLLNIEDATSDYPYLKSDYDKKFYYDITNLKAEEIEELKKKDVKSLGLENTIK